MAIPDHKARRIWISHIQDEINELVERKDKLTDFMNSQKFQTLDLVSQTLMDTQYNIMNSYINVLSARIRAAGGL